MRNVLLLGVTQALVASGMIALVLFGGIIGAELAPAPALATLPISIAIVALALATIPAALLMQRIGRKKAFISSAALAGVAALGLAWAIDRQNFALFCLCIVPLGTNLAFTQQYRFAAVEYVPSTQASRAIGTVMMGTLTAALFAPPLALVARRWIPGIEYAGSFVVVALLNFIAAGVLCALRNPPAHHTQSNGPARPLGQIARRPEFIVAVLAGLSSYAVMSFIMTATPISMHIMDGLDVKRTAWVIQSHLLGMYLPSLASGWLIARVGLERMMLLGLTMMTGCIVIAATGAHEFMHYWWGLVLLGAGWNLLFIAGTSLLTTAYTPAERFKAQAFNEFTVFGSQALASLLAGPAIQFLGWRGLNLAAAPLLLVTLAGLLVLASSRQLR